MTNLTAQEHHQLAVLLEKRNKLNHDHKAKLDIVGAEIEDIINATNDTHEVQHGHAIATGSDKPTVVKREVARAWRNV